MPIDIVLNGVAYATGHGKTPPTPEAPNGDDVLAIRFADPQSGITVNATLIGEQIPEFLGLCQKPEEKPHIEIAQAMPTPPLNREQRRSL